MALRLLRAFSVTIMEVNGVVMMGSVDRGNGGGGCRRGDVVECVSR